MIESWQPIIIRAIANFIPPPGPGKSRKTPDSSSQPKKATVLVVDDERLIADTMKEILKLAGFKALCAYDGTKALKLAAKAMPDFVVTDVIMPGMNGVELAISIQRMLPTARILLLSGQAGIADLLQQGREQGYSFELLAKPIHPEKLIAKLKKKS